MSEKPAPQASEANARRRSPFVVVASSLFRHGAMPLDVTVEGSIGGIEMRDAAVEPDATVVVAARLEGVGEDVIASASVSAPWVGQCRRCLGEARGTVQASVREFYSRRPATEDVYAMRGEEVDLECLARDAILLELPMVPLCRPDCRGLCPICGAERNESDCSCSEPPGDSPWAALDELR